MIASISFCVVDELGDRTLLETCVAAICRQEMSDSEILIWSQADPQLVGTRHVPAGESPAAQAVLAERASKDYVLLIDSAIELAPDWLAQVQSADCFEMIGTPIATPNGKRIVDWAYFDRRGEDGPTYPAHYDEWSPRAFISSLLMLARRDVLLQAASAQARLKGYQADAALCRHVEESGYRCYVMPGGQALYHGPTTARPGRQDMTFERATKLAAQAARKAMAVAARQTVQGCMRRYPLGLRSHLKILSLLYRLAIADVADTAKPLLKLRRNPPGKSFRMALLNLLAPYRLVAATGRQGRRDVRRCWETLCRCAAGGIGRVTLYEAGGLAMIACLLSCRMSVKIGAICPTAGGPAWRLKGWPLSDEQTLVAQNAPILIASADRVVFLRGRLLALGVDEGRIITLSPEDGFAAAD